jgi:hypothetical protein
MPLPCRLHHCTFTQHTRALTHICFHVTCSRRRPLLRLATRSPSTTWSMTPVAWYVCPPCDLAVLCVGVCTLPGGCCAEIRSCLLAITMRSAQQTSHHIDRSGMLQTCRDVGKSRWGCTCAQSAEVQRTVLVVSPCADDETYCRDRSECVLTRTGCEASASIGTLTRTPPLPPLSVSHACRFSGMEFFVVA